MLHKNRQRFRDRGDRRLIPMIIMRMGDDRRIDINDSFQGKRQPDQRITQRCAGGARESRPGATIRQHRVNQELFPCIFNKLS